MTRKSFLGTIASIVKSNSKNALKKKEKKSLSVDHSNNRKISKDLSNSSAISSVATSSNSNNINNNENEINKAGKYILINCLKKRFSFFKFKTDCLLAFTVFDRNGDGKSTLKDIEALFKSFEINISEADLKRIAREFDEDGILVSIESHVSFLNF